MESQKIKKKWKQLEFGISFNYHIMITIQIEDKYFIIIILKGNVLIDL